MLVEDIEKRTSKLIMTEPCAFLSVENYVTCLNCNLELRKKRTKLKNCIEKLGKFYCNIKIMD